MPADRRTSVHVDLARREEAYKASSMSSLQYSLYKPPYTNSSFSLYALSFSRAGTKETPNSLPRNWKNYWQRWPLWYCFCWAYCLFLYGHSPTTTIDGPYCGRFPSIYFNPAQASWWDPNYLTLQPDSYSQGCSVLYQCVEAQWTRKLPAADHGIPS